MIFGTGCDLVNIKRIENLVEKYGNHFITRILGKKELESFLALPLLKQSPYLAKRFAAKEAISKALKIGIGNGLNFTDIQIVNDSLGAPEVIISSNTTDQSYNKLKFNVSLSDEGPIALAFAVVSY